MRVLFFSVSYFPVVIRLRLLEGKRETSRVPLLCDFFFCGALNHLLVKAGVYTQ